MKKIKIGIVVLVIGMIGLTIAYFMAQEQGEDFTITSDNLIINFTDGDLINNADLYPLENEDYL